MVIYDFLFRKRVAFLQKCVKLSRSWNGKKVLTIMEHKKSFLDRFIERVDAIDSNSLQAYILHLSSILVYDAIASWIFSSGISSCLDAGVLLTVTGEGILIEKSSLSIGDFNLFCHLVILSHILLLSSSV